MKLVDIIFALLCGRIIGFLVSDFLKEWGIKIGFYYLLVLWLLIPFFALFCLWIADLIGRKLLFVFQGAKFLLVGAVALIFDLEIFEFFLWLFRFFAFDIPLLIKAFSFLIATFLKFWGNKYWAFEKPSKENLGQEFFSFFAITFLGTFLDVSVFYYFSAIITDPPFIPFSVWMKLSVISAGIVVALWNFLGYKFLVFKE